MWNEVCAPLSSLAVDDEIPKVFFASLGEREAVSHKLVFSLLRRRATNEIFLWYSDSDVLSFPLFSSRALGKQRKDERAPAA